MILDCLIPVLSFGSWQNILDCNGCISTKCVVANDGPCDIYFSCRVRRSDCKFCTKDIKFTQEGLQDRFLMR